MKKPKIWLLNAFVCSFIAGAGFWGLWEDKNAPGCPLLQKVGSLPVVAAPLPPVFGKDKGVAQGRPMPGRTATPEIGVWEADVSAYCGCPRCCGIWSGCNRTASGHIIRAGDKFLAAPKSIPFRTMIAVPGYNGGLPVKVEDRGSAISDRKLDVYFDSHKKAKNWGRRHIECQIFK
jgi:3D (Asp-Asp-Asp) domain-containing protein